MNNNDIKHLVELHLHLAGAEGLYPTKDFEYVFKYAKDLGIPYTIHVGETDGPSSVFDAIRFGAKRIGVSKKYI